MINKNDIGKRFIFNRDKTILESAIGTELVYNNYEKKYVQYNRGTFFNKFAPDWIINNIVELSSGNCFTVRVRNNWNNELDIYVPCDSAIAIEWTKDDIQEFDSSTYNNNLKWWI